jgi:dienelactone hydrolase
MKLDATTSRRAFLRWSALSVLGGTGAAAIGAEPRDDVPGIDERIQQDAADAPLAMRFRGSTAEECRLWQAEFSAKLRTLLGDFAPPKVWQTVTERTTDLEDHRREQLVLKAEGLPPLPIYLLTPKKRNGKRCGGVLALHGHGAHGYDPVAGRDDLPGVAAAIKAANYDYGRQLVRRGYVVAVPCLTPFGRRLGNAEAYGKQDACAVTFIRLQLLGKLLIAENLRDALWSLELLARRDDVDEKRLGCVGLSYGGRMTMLTAALEPRVRVAVVSGALNVMQERVAGHYSCGAQVIPGLLRYGDVPEIGSLIAPRPCVWEIGSRDALIAPKWADEALARMQRAYKALAAEHQLQVDRFEGAHEWSGRFGYPMLEQELSGESVRKRGGLRRPMPIN